MNPLLQPVATDFLFTGNNILSFRFFWKTSLQLEGSQYFKKIIISVTVVETVSSIFFQILTRMELAFRFSEIAFFKESFTLADGNGFPIN